MLIGLLTARRSETQLPKHVAPRGSVKAASRSNGRVNPQFQTAGRDITLLTEGGHRERNLQ